MNARPPRIFIVEDEALIAMEIKDRLTHLGYAVCGIAARGETALGAIAEANPDLVLMDVNLAGAMNGVETAHHLREQGDVPVVYLTAYADDTLLGQAADTGPFGYLVKPFEERELHATILVALYKHRMERALQEANARLEEQVRTRTAQLETSEARLKEAQRIARIGDWVVDLESGSIDWSETLYELFGRDPQGPRITLQAYYDEVVHPEDVPAVQREHEAVLATKEKRSVDHRFLRPDGTEGWVRVEGVAEYDDAGLPVRMRGTAQDVTAQKRAELALLELNATLERRIQERTAALAQSEQRLARAQRIAKVGHWVWSGPAGAWAAGKMEYSKAAAAIFGVVPEELALPDTDYLERFVHPGDRGRVRAAFGDYKKRRKKGLPLEYRILRPDGRVRYVIETTEVVAGDPDHPTEVMGTIHDVTTSKEAQARLAASEQIFASLAAVSPVGIFRTDKEGNCVYVNQRWCEITGLSAEQALGSGWMQALHPEDRERVFSDWNSAIRSHMPFHSEYRFRSPGDAVRWVIGQSAEILDAAGDVAGYMGTLTDVTELKETELALRAREGQLQRSQKMARLGYWTWRADRVRGPWHTGLRYSTAAADIFGASPEELAIPGANYLSRFVHPDDRSALSQIYGDDKPPPHGQPIEYRIVRKDGGVRHIVEIIEETYNEGDSAKEVQGMIQDITERARLQRHLAEAQRIAKLGSWEWEVETGRLFWSDETYRIYGFDPAGSVPTARMVDSIIHPEDLPRNAAALKEAIAARSHYEDHFRIVRDGTVRWLYEVGEVIENEGGPGVRVAGIVMDVTERKLAEIERQEAVEQLRISEERFSTLFYASPLSVVVATHPEERITDVNEAFCLLFGFERQEVIGKTTTDIALWANPRDRQALIERLGRGERARNLELAFRTKSGDIRTLLTSIEIVQIAGQAHSLAMSIDITDRKRTELAMQALSTDLIALEGSAYFQAAAQRVAALLDAEMAFVTRLDPARPGELRTVALIENGRFLPNVSYPIANTPSAGLIDGRSQMFERGVQQRFPADPYLAEKEIEAYASEPLRDHAGRPLGHLVAMGRRPFRDTATVATILKMFSVAVSAVMMREQIHQRDAWLRAIFENTPAEIVLKDRDLRIIAVSRNVAEARGSTMADVVGKTTKDFFSPDIAEIYEAADRKVIETGETVQQEVEEVEDGEVRYYHNSKFPLRDRNGEITAIGSISMDMTEIKRVELAMRALSTELIALEGPAYFEQAVRELALLLDADMAFITRLDPAQPEMLYTVALFEEGHLVPNISYPVADTPCAQVVEGRPNIVPHGLQQRYPADAFLVEKAMEAYAGEPLVSLGGRPIGHIGVMSRRPFGDTATIATTLKMFAVAVTAAMMRERSRRQYRDLFEFAPDALVLSDRQGRIVLANRQAERIFGWTRAELAGQPVEMLVPQDIRQRHVGLRDGFLRTLEMRRMAGDRPALQATRKDGSVFPVEIDLAPVETESGVMIAAAVRDITARKALEHQLAQAIKMDAIGKLTGGMAHDFNNYLGVIIGNLDLLGETAKPDPGQTRFIDAALKGAERAAELTQSLLAFSRRQPLDARTTDLNQRIREIVKLLQRTLGEDIEVAMELAPELWQAKVDGAQLDSCIINLANNARDAMPSGGGLTIVTRNAHLDEQYARLNPGTVAGDYALIEVSDTGEGMLPDIAARVFEPFFTTKGPGHGTGLGLSMVYGFVKQSGGHIKIYSEPGHGTTVRIYLPRTLGADAEEAPAAAVGSSRLEGTETVLVVEDNEEVRETAAAQLVSLGYRVIEAANAEAALAILERRTPHVDLLFTDVVMPGKLDGYALATVALESWPGIKVLLTSGFPGDTLRRNGKHGAKLRLLGKPYRKDELARAIRATLEAEAGTPESSG